MHVLLVYKNFAAHCGISHIGLGVSAINTAKCLTRAGVPTEVLPLKDQFDLRKFLNLHRGINTHVVVSAPWVSTAAYSQLTALFPRVHFAMNCHSNVGFLQADANGIALLRQQLELETGTQNFKVAGNSLRLCEFIANAYGDPCQYLPNLYFLDGSQDRGPRAGWSQTGGVLRIGIFGATRSLKNILSAVGASIVISRDLKSQTEIYVSTGREDGPEVKRILQSAKNLVAGLPAVTLKEVNWSSWPVFRKVVESMHLLMQPSYTESFNMVTADGAAHLVPSVVSSAVTWAPKEWQADVDDVEDIARAGVALIHDAKAGWNGLKALQEHNAQGLRAWMSYLNG